MANIYISSTYEDLKDHREAVYRALRRLGHDVQAMEDYVAADQRPVDKCLADVAACDLYVGILAWRYGYVPPDGNPDGRSITELEYREAERLRTPRLIFMVDEEAAWPRKFVDTGEADERLRALRAELGQRTVRSLFATTHELAELVATAVTNAIREPAAGQEGRARPVSADVQLRTPPDQLLPDSPYPLLGPYTHPATFAGRDREIAELERLVGQPQLVLSLHATSGTGKSSLLMAGLGPRLRAQGYPVSVERHPGEPGLARRLVGDLLVLPQDTSLADGAPGLLAEFVDWIAHAHTLAKKPPILILDQVDDFLRDADRRDEALARLGPLMAATAHRLPDVGGYPCRWLLCYRHEFHGEVDEWLRDVLLQARGRDDAEIAELPHDLHPPDRFHSYVIPPMGTPRPGEDAHTAARRSFLDAIDRPLMLKTNSGGARRYGETFVGGGAQRVADAFGRARIKNRNAPLVPEFQIVMGHLLARQAAQSGVRRLRRSPDATPHPETVSPHPTIGTGVQP